LMGICKKFNVKYPSVNIMLERTHPYQQAGRYETAEQASEIDEITKLLLYEAEQPYILAQSTKQTRLLDLILPHLEKS